MTHDACCARVAGMTSVLVLSVDRQSRRKRDSGLECSHLSSLRLSSGNETWKGRSPQYGRLSSRLARASLTRSRRAAAAMVSKGCFVGTDGPVVGNCRLRAGAAVANLAVDLSFGVGVV